MFEQASTYEARRENFLISTDKARLQLVVIDAFIATSYWGADRPPALTHTSIEHCLCFGVYELVEPDQPQQIGFTRVITDYALFAYVADVFILPPYQGQGLGKWLIETVVNHPDLKPVYRWLLATHDAHGLYSQYEFKPLPKPENWMIRVNSEAFHQQLSSSPRRH